MKKPFIILAGPTAAGKTKLSILLAKRVGGEIISADSMQVYKGMDIGSAKIRPDEMEGIPHYLIDVLDPREEFHVHLFQTMTKQAMEEIYAKGKIPILVGGTGFYIQSVLYDIDFAKQEEKGRYRLELEEIALRPGGKEELYKRLQDVDPGSCKIIHANNVKRVIRALEFFEDNKIPISVHNKEQREKLSPYNSCYFVITDQREKLYHRIDQRVDEMFEEGLVDEVEHLKDMGLTEQHVSMQGLGYKEILRALSGTITMEEARYLIKRDTRHFAKRQLTWFRREKDVIWVDREQLGNENAMLEFILSHLQAQGIINQTQEGISYATETI
ncbi:MAG: tRNA (adenosine(37)-N6)-dimethylallyltransferase MiaA [Lachnospiraceae bacterium]